MTDPRDAEPDHAGYVDPRLVPLCAEIAAHAPIFESELAALQSSDFVPWFDVAVYSGGWLVFPLVAQLDPQPPGFDLARNRLLCPRSHAVLAAHPRILLAGFSRLMPGTRVHPHSDHPGARVLRFHLGLRSAGGTRLVFDGVPRESRRGSTVLFDHSMIHSSHNLGAEPRDLLLVDIRLTDDEVTAVVRARGAVHLGSTAGHA
ncbi:MAG: aspartyl/asparaginyl beta-hydroxylase domain-containing protein [Planctomycetes bacterium]|nr:aspartyl/asparaginyl beta-hydroxylase domain-containing protein [Planctomycetota bacterium]